MSEEIYQLLVDLSEFQSYDSEYDGRMYRFCVHCNRSEESDQPHSKDCLTLRARQLISTHFAELEQQRMLDAELKVKREHKSRILLASKHNTLTLCPGCGKHFTERDMPAHFNSKRCKATQQKNQRSTGELTVAKKSSFVLYWFSGKAEVVEGVSISDAFNKKGYGAGALRALDFYDNGSTIAYTWKGGKWVKAVDPK